MLSHPPRFRRGCAALLLALVSTALAVRAADFTHEESDLPADPTVRYGKLPNGVRYALKANAEPRDRTALRLLVETGSLEETDTQRGLAHFLEHMAFNGSEHYPPGTLIEFFQRMGMDFGGDTNAFTSFDRTVYMIDLPLSNDANLTEGLRVFHDYAGGLLLLQEEIDNERGIVLSEKRTRDSVQWRSFLAELNHFFDGSRIEQRLPIGTVEVLTTANRDEFVDYWNTWYRPENLTIVAVGDFDVDHVETLVIDTFSDLTARAPARDKPAQDTVEPVQGLSILHHAEPEAGAVTVSIQTLLPYTEEPDTAANRVKYLPRDLAFAMFNRRLSELAKQENAPFLGGSAGAGVAYDIADNASVQLTANADRWDDALTLAENELRRALMYGFQPAELQEVVAGMRNGLEQAVATASTRRSSGLAMAILSAVADKNVFTTPTTSLELYTPALDAVTPEACLEAFREAWTAPHRHVTVIGNSPLGADAEQVITGVFANAMQAQVDPPAAIEQRAFAYTGFGPAGEVVSREDVADLDVTLVEFANGVRLNLKKTDFSADSISMSIRIGTGQLSEPVDQEGLGVFGQYTFTLAGLGQHSSDELRRILAGRNVGVGFNVGDDAFTFGGGTTPDDLLLQLQLATAYIVDPGYRPEAARQISKAITQYYTQLKHVPQGPLTLEVARLLASGDPRFGMPAEEVLAQRNLEELRAWLTPELRQGALEIGLVGDLDVDAAIDAVAQTLGALPPRGPKPELAERRKVSFPDEPFAKEYRVETEIPKGVVAIYWPTTDGMDAQVSRRLNVLGNILGDRLRIKVREELAGSYSPNAGSSASSTYPGYGNIQAFIVVDPQDAEELAQVTIDLANELAVNGTNEDELQRAVEPILTGLRESARTNGYWLGAVLASAQEFPQRLDWARSRYSDNEAITVAEINALAARYLSAEQAFKVIVLPEGAE